METVDIWERIETFETKAAPVKVIMSSLFDKTPTESEIHILAKIRKEHNEIKQIERNMVVNGLLPSGSNDDERKAHDKCGVES